MRPFDAVPADTIFTDAVLTSSRAAFARALTSTSGMPATRLVERMRVVHVVRKVFG